MENKYGKSGHCLFFQFFQALNGAFEVQFSGLHYLHIIKDTDSMFAY